MLVYSPGIVCALAHRLSIAGTQRLIENAAIAFKELSSEHQCLLSGSFNSAILHLGWPPEVGDFRVATKAYHPKQCSAHLLPARHGLNRVP